MPPDLLDRLWSSVKFISLKLTNTKSDLKTSCPHQNWRRIWNIILCNLQLQAALKAYHSSKRKKIVFPNSILSFWISIWAKMLNSSGIFCCGSDKLLDLNKALVSYQSAKGSDRTRWCSIHLTIYIKYEEICKSTRGHLTGYNGVLSWNCVGRPNIQDLNCRPQPCCLIRYWVMLLSSALIGLTHSVHGAELSSQQLSILSTTALLCIPWIVFSLDVLRPVGVAA